MALWLEKTKPLAGADTEEDNDEVFSGIQRVITPTEGKSTFIRLFFAQNCSPWRGKCAYAWERGCREERW